MKTEFDIKHDEGMGGRSGQIPLVLVSSVALLFSGCEAFEEESARPAGGKPSAYLVYGPGPNRDMGDRPASVELDAQSQWQSGDDDAGFEYEEEMEEEMEEGPETLGDVEREVEMIELDAMDEEPVEEDLEAVEIEDEMEEVVEEIGEPLQPLEFERLPVDEFGVPVRPVPVEEEVEEEVEGEEPRVIFGNPGE